jgi:hypothetical protein
MKQILFLPIIFALFLIPCLAQKAQVQKCKSEVKGGKYKFAGEGRTITGDKNLLIFITIKSKNINQEFMSQLAKRLKSEYCNEQRIQVVIFDDPKLANVLSMSDLLQSQGKTILMRGFYSFDRLTGEDEIEFSSKRGNPTSENKIKLL